MQIIAPFYKSQHIEKGVSSLQKTTKKAGAKKPATKKAAPKKEAPAAVAPAATTEVHSPLQPPI